MTNETANDQATSTTLTITTTNEHQSPAPAPDEAPTVGLWLAPLWDLEQECLIPMPGDMLIKIEAAEHILGLTIVGGSIDSLIFDRMSITDKDEVQADEVFHWDSDLAVGWQQGRIVETKGRVTTLEFIDQDGHKSYKRIEELTEAEYTDLVEREKVSSRSH